MSQLLNCVGGGLARLPPRWGVDAITKRPAWISRGRAPYSPGLAWIGRARVVHRGYARRVMAGICAQCPVLTECEQYASTGKGAGRVLGRPSPATASR